jgi:UDP-3-O-[3-hydroxymyristoyl] glucosamine N-acyltransferase
MNYTVAQLAKMLGAECYGDTNTQIKGLSPLNEVNIDHLIFADGEDNIKAAFASNAAAVILSKKPEDAFNKPVIVYEHPLMAFAQLITVFYPDIEKPAGVHPTAYIGHQVTLGKDIHVGPYAVIEDGCQIGDKAVIHAHAVIREQCKIGDRCEIHPHVTIYPHTILDAKVIIHAGTTIGSDGFGYRFINGIHHKLPHAGHVVIGENVEIGANTVVDRATLGTTKIGKGTKIDNLVQIAHSVKIGEHNIICAFSGIAGSSSTGNHVILAADVGIGDHVKIEDQVTLGARTGVPPKKTLKKGVTYLGNPARPKEKALEQELSSTRIPYMRKHILNMQEKIQELEQKIAKLTSEIES